MTDVLSAIKNRYSTRGYEDIALTDEEIDVLVNAGLQAPTAANKQECHFSVVKKDNAALIELDKDLKQGREGATTFFYDAPVVIFISADESFSWSPLDSGIAVENIALAAEGLGLGNLIIGCVKDILTGEKKEYYSKAFGFPEGYKYEVAIAVGHGNAVKEPHTYDYAKNVSVL